MEIKICRLALHSFPPVKHFEMVSMFLLLAQQIHPFYFLDFRIILLGLCTSFFEAAIYIHGIEWTPTLESAQSMIISDPLPLGFCFGGQVVRADLLC